MLVAGVAGAAGEKSTKGSSGSEKGGGVGGAVSAGGGGATPTGIDYSGDRSAHEAEGDSRDIDKKKWEVSAEYEVHRLVRQSDLGGAAANKLLNVIGAGAEYDFDKWNRVQLRTWLLERFIADQNETGLRMEDLILSYTHYMPLAWQMTLKPGVWVTAPISFASQKESNITSPRVYVSLEKYFGRYLRVEPRTAADAYIDRYRTPDGGGNPNAKYRLSVGLSIEYSMPFHPPLSVGMDAITGYNWYYDVQNSQTNPGGVHVQNNPNDTQQPIQQTYGGEVFVRYLLPGWGGFHSDVSVAYAQGDPTLGYESANHDGLGHVYPFGSRRPAEFYATLSLRY